MEDRQFKFCSQCGTKNSKDARFCSGCGAELDDLAENQPSDGRQAPTTAMTQATEQAAVPAEPPYNTLESRFTGGAFANFFINLVVIIVTACTLLLAYPAMLCWKMRWQTKHTYINGRHLVFDGKAMQLFGKYIIWLLLSIITLGIYYLLCMRVNLLKWSTKHTHIEGVTDGESKFTGGALGLLGHTLLVWFITAITLSLGYYWGRCHLERWYAKHTIYDGYNIEFDGKAIQYFGKCICWELLTIITIGIYSFWLIVKSHKWITKHTVFCPGQALPPITDKKYINYKATAQTPAAQVPAANYGYQAQTTAAYGQPAPEVKQPNGMAIAGFVLSILSFIGFFTTGIVPLLGIIFSGVGISKANKTGSNKGLAIAGLILGILALLSFIISIISIVLSFSRYF